MGSGSGTCFKKIEGPGTGFCAYLINTLLLIFALCLRMAYFLKNLNSAKVKSNLKRNISTASRGLTSLFSVAEVCWDRIHSFDGFSVCLTIFHEFHAWFYCSTWSLVWLFYRSFVVLFGYWMFISDCYIYFLLAYGERIHLPGEKIAISSHRSEERRRRRHEKKYLVHSISNVADL